MSRGCTAGRTAPQPLPLRSACRCPLLGRWNRARRWPWPFQIPPHYNTACYVFVIPSQWNMYVPAATVCFRGRTEARSEPSMFVGPLAATDQSRLARRRVRLCSSRGRVEIGRWTVVEALVREVPHVWAGGIVNNTQDRPSPNHRNHMVKTQNTLLCTSVRDIVGTV